MESFSYLHHLEVSQLPAALKRQPTAQWGSHSANYMHNSAVNQPNICIIGQSFSQLSAPLRIHLVSRSSQVNNLWWERSVEGLNKVGIPSGCALQGKLT
jgi:hypothetical protein